MAVKGKSRNKWMGFLLLVVLLVACQGVEREAPQLPGPETERPAAITAEVMAPWEEDPKGYLLALLNRGTEEDAWGVYFWCLPGSGPYCVEMSVAEYGQTVRELFAALDWQVTEPIDYVDRPEDAPGNQPDWYSVQLILHREEMVTFLCDHNSGELRVSPPKSEKGGWLYFRADGAEALCEQIALLWPGPEADFGRVRVPPQGSERDTAAYYVEQVLECSKGEGHITDYTVLSLELYPQEPSEDGEANDWITFLTQFKVKPAHPELSYWQGRDLDIDGWTEYRWNTVLGFDAKDERYGDI